MAPPGLAAIEAAMKPVIRVAPAPAIVPVVMLAPFALAPRPSRMMFEKLVALARAVKLMPSVAVAPGAKVVAVARHRGRRQQRAEQKRRKRGCYQVLHRLSSCLSGPRFLNPARI